MLKALQRGGLPDLSSCDIKPIVRLGRGGLCGVINSQRIRCNRIRYIRPMRTTLDIDSYVLAAAKALAQSGHSTAGRVISDVMRRAIALGD